MSRLPLLLLTVGSVLAAGAGCAKTQPAAAASSAHLGSIKPSRNTGNACDRKLLTLDDASAVLADPATSAVAIPGDAQSCTLGGSGSGLTVPSRAGLGRTTLAVWKSGKMPISGTPLSGVGDEAVWVESLHEVVAQKNNLLCDIALSGPPWGLKKGSTAEHQAAIGKLCNKIFSEVP
jgi:hypothetical protein